MKIWLFLMLFIVGCNSKVAQMSSISGASNSPSGVQINFNVSGLTESPVTLSLNGEEHFSFNANGPHTIRTKLQINNEYEFITFSNPVNGNCFVKNPKGVVATITPVIEVHCGTSTDNFVRGQISGNMNGVMRLEFSSGSTVTKDISNGSRDYFIDVPLGTDSSLEIITQPGNKCYFANGTTRTSPTPGNDEHDIWCAPHSDLIFDRIKIEIFGLTGGNVKVGSTLNQQGYLHYYNSATVHPGNFQENKRYVFEILETPGKRCFFRNSKSHITTLYPVTNHTLQIDCLSTRPICHTPGLDMPSVDGILKDMSCLMDKIIYAGSFSRIGRQYGIIKSNIDYASPKPSLHVFDRINGKVNKIISDGKSGFFIAGSFARVGAEKKFNLVRMDNNFVIDESFTTETNGEVKEIIYSKNELFIFGNFTTVTNVNDGVLSRRGFAKIDLISYPEKISSVELPLHFGLNGNVSAKLIDWNLYFHAEVLNGATNETTSFVMNKNSGSVSARKTNAVEQGNSLYWKDPAGKVWLINATLGLVDPINLDQHPKDTAHLKVQLNKTYTLDSESRLYQSNGSSIDVFDLKTLMTNTATGAINFGFSSTGDAGVIRGAGVGFEYNGGMCFVQKEGYGNITIHYASSSWSNKGFMCFNSNDFFVTSINPNAQIYPTSTHVVGNDIYFNSPFYKPVLANNISMINAVNNQILAWESMLPAGSTINSVETDGSYFYVGGDFTEINNCTSCRYLARLQIGTPLNVNPEWQPSGLNLPVKNISVSEGVLAAMLEGLSNYLMAMPISGPENTNYELIGSTNNEILNIGDSLLYHDSGRYVFRRYDTSDYSFREPDNYHTYPGPISYFPDNFVVTKDSPLLYTTDLDGDYKDPLPIYEFIPSKLKLTAVSGNVCYMDIRTMAITCINPSGDKRLDASAFNEDYTLYKGIGDFLVIGAGQSSPLVFIPTAAAAAGTGTN